MNHNKEKLIERILFKEEILGLVEPKHHPDATYKTKVGLNEVEIPLPLGTKVICSYNAGWGKGNTVKGYYLGVIVYTLDHSSWRNEVIVQVVKVSQPSLDPILGTLRVENLPRRWDDYLSSVVGVSPPVKWEDYVLRGEKR